MEEYRPNSHSYKARQEVAEKKKVEKVIKGKARVKENKLRKFTDAFISEDARDLKTNFVMDFVVPTIKDVGFELIKTIFFGRKDKIRASRSPLDTISYNRFYQDTRERDRRPTESLRPRHSHNDIVLESRGEGEAVLAQMSALIDEYDVVTIADLYDMIGVTGNHTDNNYGWYDISNASVERTRDGYVLDLPKARPLDR